MADPKTPAMGNAVNAEQATKIAADQKQGNQPNQEQQPDFMKMTGAEAKAWVEAQKTKEAEKNQPKPRQPDGKFAPKDGVNPTKEPSSTPDAIKEAVAEAKRKLKIDNEEIDEEEVIKTYKSRKEHQRSANKIYQDGLAARKQAEEFINMMKDPVKLIDALVKLGHDPRALSENYLAEQLEAETLDPKEKEFRTMKAKLQQIEEMERLQKQEAERRVQEQMKAKFAQEYNAKFIDALKNSGLPQTKPMVAEMAKYISRATKLGYELSPQEAATLVMEDIRMAQQRLLGDSDGETLMKLLGEDVANKVRKWDTSRLKDPSRMVSTPTEQPQPREKKSPDKRMTAKEWQLHKRGLK